MPVGDDDTQLGTAQVVAVAAHAIDAELVAKRYRIVRWLGGGGMGRVYEALDTELEEKVALKVLHGGLTADALERFRREVKLTRRILHRNVARMFDIGDHGAEKFLTMELVDGESLAARTGTVIAWAELQPIAVQICAGLAAAHATNVVHRDLKPDNVLVERGTGRVVLTDFGVARAAADPSVTQVGAVVGTPRYMSPEQLAGRDVDARSDLFSLGLMMYELATGTRPWSGDTAIAIAINQQTVPPRPFAAVVPPSFAALVGRCLEIDPAKRPQSAAEIGAAIESATEQPAKIATGIHTTQTVRPARTHDSSPTHITAVTTVAVLPVACGPGDEYLADGMLDDLIDTLSSSPTIRVRPAGVVRGVTEPDPRVIGRTLEVDHVVVASIRRAPAGLRIAARLINVADGFQVWVQRTECIETEILEVSESVGRGVAAALSSRATIATRPTDPRAVDLYLRARAELRRFWGSHTQQAMELLTEAAAIAPTSAPILGALAYASVQTWVMRGDVDLFPVARAAIERGLAAGHGDAYLASAIFKFNHGDLEDGARELGTALVRAPMSAQAHELAGRILIETEATEEARHHFTTAIALDPGRSHLIDADLARVEALLGDWGAAMVRVERLAKDPDKPIAQLGAVLETRLAGWRGDRAVVLAGSTRFMERLDKDGPSKLFGYIRESIHNGTLDLNAWQQLADRFAVANHPKRPQVFSFQILAEISVSIGTQELAIAVLDQAQRAGLIDVMWLDHCPLFAPLKALPQFHEIRDRVAKRARAVHAALHSVTG